MSTLDDIQQNFPRRPKKRDFDKYRKQTLKPALSSVDCFNASFLSPRDDATHACVDPGWHGCDIHKVIQFFDFLHNKCTHNSHLDRTVKEAMQELIPKLPKIPASKEELRVYLMLPACHLMTDANMYDFIVCPFASAVMNLDEHSQQILDDWFMAIPLNHFRRLAKIFKDAVRNLAPKWLKYKRTTLKISTNLESCLLLLDKLYKVNEMRDEKMHGIFFQMSELFAYAEVITNDLKSYRKDQTENQFHICKFPFLFNGEIKHCLLREFNKSKMEAASQSGPTIISVDRTTIVEDAMSQFQFWWSINENMLKTDLSEFFTLIFQELLKPSRSLFTDLKETPNAVWFNQKESDLHYFHFAGFMLGLALYHSQLISLPFPLAIFKKLLGMRQMDFSDLQEIHPKVAEGLHSILGTDGVEDLGLDFQVSLENKDTFELCENGKNIEVTDDNKKDYVRLMVDFYLNSLTKNTAKEFEQFQKGFDQAFDSQILKLLKFQPSELRSYLIGQEKIDTASLETNAEYEGGYKRNSQTIRNFWDIIHSLSEDHKRKFVFFASNSERIPLSGLKLTICPRPAFVGERIEDVMPQPAACFKRFLLPDNPDKEGLQERLLSALDGSYEFTKIQL